MSWSYISIGRPAAVIDDINSVLLARGHQPSEHPEQEIRELVLAAAKLAVRSAGGDQAVSVKANGSGNHSVRLEVETVYGFLSKE